jgi:hypothetical protein
MKKFMVFLAFSVLALSSMAFADGAPTDIISTDQFLGFLFQSLGGMGGMKGMALVVVVVQVMMKLLQTDFAIGIISKVVPAKDGELSGKIRIALVCGLTLMVGVFTLHMQGLTWGASLMHSSTLTAIQVLGNQIWQQFGAKSATPTA